MEIVLNHISIKELTDGYKNNQEEGVYGYGGHLNIRPKYQREFVYNEAQQAAVITSVINNRPLNVMYWVDNGGDFEVLDGQQRSLSICEYVSGGYSVNYRYFHNLTPEEQQQILDYKILVYFCKGSDKEKLEWFETINIAGEKLTKQELLNAVYTGRWLTDAKRYFSRTGCPAYQIAKDYVKGSPIRQDFLETALKWAAKGGSLAEYMAANQNEVNASELWRYFNNVITWVQIVFPKYRKEMKGLNWGSLYESFSDKKFDADEIEAEIVQLLSEDDVTKKAGVYPYVLSRNERYLSIRAFTTKQKRQAYEQQQGCCPMCKETFELSEMEADHITPFSQGGRTTMANLQMLCKPCNRAKLNT